MRSAELVEGGEIRLSERPVPRPPAGWSLVKVASAGVCGTELHFLKGLMNPMGFPRVLGHEIAGMTIDSRSGSAGALVAVYNVLNCGSCRFCRSNRDRLCIRSRGMVGFTCDGGFAEYVCAPDANLIPVPEGLAPDVAAVLACSGMTAVHAVRRAGVSLGETVVVNGIGGVGLMIAQVAALVGATVVAVGDHPDKIEMARTADGPPGLLIEGEEGYDNLEERVVGLVGTKPEVFFETVGTRATMAAGFRCLSPGGRFVQVGYTGDRIDLHPGELIRNELSIISSAAGSKQDLETALALAASGRIRPVIADRYPLDRIEEAIGGLRNRRVLGRNVILFDP